ncbi:MAG: DUF3037 domain-containing protein [Polyangiales bacterium]
MAEGYAYAVLRVVPDVARGEFVNVGAVVYCEARGFLGVAVELDEARVRALSPDVDVATLRACLDAAVRACEGEGPIGALSLRERFRWVTAPSDTMVQPSPVHAGLCDDPRAALERVMNRMVRRRG